MQPGMGGVPGVLRCRPLTAPRRAGHHGGMAKPTGNPPGRPTKLNQELEDTLIGAVEQGLPYKLACELVGIYPSTMQDWRAKGEADIKAGETESDAARFYLRFVRARSQQAMDDIAVLNSATNEVWTDPVTGKPAYLPESALSARKFKLAARFPEHYGKSRLELTGANGGPVQTIQVRVDNANEGRAAMGLPPLEVVDKPEA